MTLNVNCAKSLIAAIFSKPALTQQEYEDIQRRNLQALNLQAVGVPKDIAEQFVSEYSPEFVRFVLNVLYEGKHKENMEKLRELAVKP